ncbi:hypothetical protein CspHIS471_0205640 [Cutaneotrichosporon sp. HIS471]|nr:hypothetical protein CspHIS471_0205640 [Cutaneotrichosporon sp. HIS471]
MARLENNLSDDDYDELASDLDDGYDVKPYDTTIGQILKGTLDEPRFKSVNMRYLYELIQTETVNLNPDYQRDVVWPDARQVQLIQSLMQHYFVPPVIFAVENNEEKGLEERICIDGKQRCTSIQRFIDGRIPFISPSTREKFWYTAYPGQKGGKQLPDRLKQRFDQLQIQIVEYRHLDMNQQRDIFQRVQLGMPLSAAEKLQALGGHWTTWITHLEKKYVVEPGGLKDKLPKFDIGRGRPFQVLASLCMIAYDPESKTFPTSTTITRFLERGDRPERSFQRKVEMTLAILVAIATDFYDTAFETVEQRVAPVEFMGIGLLIFKRMNTYSTLRLAEEITKMRVHIRSRHLDVRANAKVVKDVYAYLDGVPAGKLPGEISAREDFNGSDSDDEVQQARIRKRQRDEDRDDTYYDAAAARGEESAVAAGLRSKKSKGKAAARPEPASTLPITSQPPPAYAPRPSVAQPAPAAGRPPPIGMDAPNRGPAYAPPAHQPPHTQNRSPPQPYIVPNYRNQGFSNPGHGYQQPPYGGRR